MGKNDDLAVRILQIYAEARTQEDVIFMTYGELANRLDKPGQHRLIGDPLDRVRILCEARQLPDIATVIVDKRSLESGKMKPSEKALEKYGGWDGLRKEQARVIAYEWSSQAAGLPDTLRSGKS